MMDDDEKRLGLADDEMYADASSSDGGDGTEGGGTARDTDAVPTPKRTHTPRRTFAVLLLGIVLGLYLPSYTSIFFDLPGGPPRPPHHPHNMHYPHHPHAPHHPDHHRLRDPFGGKTLAPANYTVVKGVFRQDEDDFDGTDYDLLKDGFGLLDKSPERWRNFTRYITDLNRRADAHTTYKVLFVARHGEGYHNVAEAQYGTPAWNCHWSMLTGDGNITWGPDPVLTPLGEAQARAANAGWKEQIKDGVPVPQALYSSPLRRAGHTLEITWGDILLNRGVRPVIKESLRESIGLHTCDQRSSKSLIAATFPQFDFEPSFTEHDPLWDAVYQETEAQEAVRLRLALNEIFATDDSTFVGITAHGGVIGALFRAIGKKRFQLQTGGFVPFVLKATSHPTATFEPIVRGQSATAPACTTAV